MMQFYDKKKITILPKKKAVIEGQKVVITSFKFLFYPVLICDFRSNVSHLWIKKLQLNAT